jgi:hypothetical protein
VTTVGGWRSDESVAMPKEQKNEPILNKIMNYKTNWIKHVDRM